MDKEEEPMLPLEVDDETGAPVVAYIDTDDVPQYDGKGDFRDDWEGEIDGQTVLSVYGSERLENQS